MVAFGKYLRLELECFLGIKGNKKAKFCHHCMKAFLVPLFEMQIKKRVFLKGITKRVIYPNE